MERWVVLQKGDKRNLIGVFPVWPKVRVYRIATRLVSMTVPIKYFMGTTAIGSLIVHDQAGHIKGHRAVEQQWAFVRATHLQRRKSLNQGIMRT